MLRDWEMNVVEGEEAARRAERRKSCLLIVSRWRLQQLAEASYMIAVGM